MTNKNPKISSSQVVPTPKIKLFPDDPLVKKLKSEHYELINPFSYSISSDSVASLPEDPEDPQAPEDPEYPEDPTDQNAEAPSLEDITVVKSEIYYDSKNVPHARFIFNIKNHVGDSVVGVYGKGG